MRFAERRHAGKGRIEGPGQVHQKVVTAAQMRALVRQHGTQLPLVERADRAGGDHDPAAAAGQAVYGWLVMTDDDDAKPRVGPADHGEGGDHEPPLPRSAWSSIRRNCRASPGSIRATKLRSAATRSMLESSASPIRPAVYSSRFTIAR